MGMAVPAYFTPSSGYWSQIIIDSPPISGYVIMNPDSGPGGAYDATYAPVIAATQAAGLKVLGYVYSDYAGRSTGSIEVDIDSYNAWYNVDGIFIDQCSGLTADIAYYQGLVAYVGTFCVLNPGAIPADRTYMSMADSVCIFEDDYATYLTWMSPSWASSYPSSAITHLVYDCGDQANMAIGDSVLAMAGNAGYRVYHRRHIAKSLGYSAVLLVCRTCAAGGDNALIVATGYHQWFRQRRRWHHRHRAVAANRRWFQWWPRRLSLRLTPAWWTWQATYIVKFERVRGNAVKHHASFANCR